MAFSWCVTFTQRRATATPEIINKLAIYLKMQFLEVPFSHTGIIYDRYLSGNLSTYEAVY